MRIHTAWVQFMARALRAWATNQGGKHSVRNLRYGPRTRLVRGIYTMLCKYAKQTRDFGRVFIFSFV